MRDRNRLDKENEDLLKKVKDLERSNEILQNKLNSFLPPKPDANEGLLAAKKLFGKCLDSLQAFENDLLSRLIYTYEI